MGSESSTAKTSTSAPTSGHDGSNTHTVSVYDGAEWHELDVPHGRTLRDALWAHDLPPHGALTRHLNCSGRGHCAACTVDIEEGAEAPDQWLDTFLHAQDVGRLSCQIDVTQDMTIRL
jgi:ferredoxin